MFVVAQESGFRDSQTISGMLLSSQKNELFGLEEDPCAQIGSEFGDFGCSRRMMLHPVMWKLLLPTF